MEVCVGAIRCATPRHAASDISSGIRLFRARSGPSSPAPLPPLHKYAFTGLWREESTARGEREGGCLKRGHQGPSRSAPRGCCRARARPLILIINLTSIRQYALFQTCRQDFYSLRSIGGFFDSWSLFLFYSQEYSWSFSVFWVR